MNTTQQMHNIFMPAKRAEKELQYTHRATEKTKRGVIVRTHDVEFNVKHDGESVTEIISVWVFNKTGPGCIDITDSAMQFMDLDNKIEEITDWKELYHNSND